MGEVYRATDSVLGRTVAVKLLSDRYAMQDDARARFRREASAAARLSSAPNVVTVFDVAEHHGRPLIVMEFLEGGSVYERLRDGRVSQAEALRWLEQAGSALDRAHAHGVIHRDVKPANLLLDLDGNVHVSDFGIASTTGDDTLTAPGTILGTAGYLAPEQARGEPATAASDRYALAVVAFELLTGRRPYGGDTPTTEAFAHLNAEIPSAVELDPTLPVQVDAVFQQALAKDSDTRPETALELVADLRHALRKSDEDTVVLAAPLPTPLSTPAPVARRYDSRRLRWPVALLAGAALLLLGAGTAAVLASDDASSGAQTVTRVRTLVSTVSDTASTTTVTQTTTLPEETTSSETTTGEESDDGLALNDEGFALMQDGDYEAARPLLERAVVALAGTGVVAEGYANYNLAFTRFALGDCEGVPELLDRSEEVQGSRSEIDRLRRDVRKECEGNPGKGNDDD
jgi:eukaryotic-like serine/threonine-protein kinase